MNRGREEHRRFLNRYYGTTRHVYDLTRRYYLFGRDRLLEDLLAEPWERLVEVGPGTGRNLLELRAARRGAVLGGLEASDAMLEHARARCPFAELRQGFAEDSDLAGLLGERPDRILFSYSLSMMQDPVTALANARGALARGGEVAVVDFADFRGLPWPLRPVFRAFLGAFHVADPTTAVAEQAGRLRFGPGRYYFVARLPPLASS